MLRNSLFLAVGLLLIVARGALAEPPTNQPSESKKVITTTVFVDDIHCKSCARKLARKLFTVPGVKRVRANVPKDYAEITPQEKKNVSPAKVWEATEAAGFEVVKIVGPEGTLEKKPESVAQQPPAGTTGG